jgi:hypothetical protein
MRTLWWVIACVACSSDPEPPKWEPPPSCEWLRDPEDLAPGDGVSWLGTRVGYLYWVRNLEDRRELLRVPIAGGEPETIASGLQRVAPVLSTHDIVWADAQGIVRRGHARRDAEVVDATATNVQRIQANGFALYWREVSGPIYRIAADGARSTLPRGAGQFVTDRGAVYWEERDGGRVDDNITIYGMNETTPGVHRPILHGRSQLHLLGAFDGEVFASHHDKERDRYEVLGYEFMRGRVHPYVEAPRVVPVEFRRHNIVMPNGDIVYETMYQGVRGLARRPTHGGKATTIAIYPPEHQGEFAFDHEFFFQVLPLRRAEGKPRITRRRRCDVGGPAS